MSLNDRRAAASAARPGRPPKFLGESRVVTVTLPESTLATLAAIDKDRARAIVRVTEMAAPEADHSDSQLVQLLSVKRESAVITVPFSARIADISGLDLIQILPNRYLVVLTPGMALAEVEVALLDDLAAIGPDEDDERMLLAQLLDSLRLYRRSLRAKIGEVILVDL